MPAIRRRWTAEQVRALIAESERFWPRYELLGGELLVTPAPGGIHQVAVTELLDSLDWLPVGATVPLRVDVSALFAKIWSDYRSIGHR